MMCESVADCKKNYFTPKSLPSFRLGSAMDFRADGKV